MAFDQSASTMELDVETKIAFEELVDNSIIERYDGDLERHQCPKTAEVHYTPLDTDHIRTLLNRLWGESLTAETIEDFFERLTKDGAEEWPHGWCEEDAAGEVNEADEDDRTLP